MLGRLRESLHNCNHVLLCVYVCVCAMCIDSLGTPLFKAPSRHHPPLPQVEEYTSIVHHFGPVCVPS